jgi:hypothetical protein
MTKVIILGKTVGGNTKPIEFKQCFNPEMGLKETFSTDFGYTPSDWAHIELIRKSTRESVYDVMFAYNNSRDSGCLYLGHFNDGIVE